MASAAGNHPGADDRVPMNYRSSSGHHPYHASLDVGTQPTQGYPSPHAMPVAGASSSSTHHQHQQQFAHSPEDSPPPQWEAIETTPPGSSKKVRAKPATDRTPGTTLIPTTRVETIVTAGGSTGALSKEAVYVLTVATEEFIKKLSTVSYVRADIEKRAITSYGDVADTVDKFPEFQFLKETVPRPMPLSMALATRNTLEQQRELYLDKVAEEAAQKSQSAREETEDEGHAFPLAESISDAKGKGKSKAPNANGSTVSKSKAGKSKLRGNASAAGDAPQPPSVRSERLKNKRAKMEQENADAAETSHPPPEGMELDDAPDGDAQPYPGVGVDGMSISSAPSAKSKPKSAKSAKVNNMPSNVVDPTPSQSTSASPAPSSSAQAGPGGYKIKIKPRQSSSQAVPIGSSLSQGVENVSNSLAYASLYATPTSSAVPISNGTGEVDVGPPASKRPRLHLHTSESPSQQNGIMDLAVQGSAHSSSKKGKSNGATSEKKSKVSSSPKKKASTSERSKQNASSSAFGAPSDVGIETPPPLWTHVPLPPPPSTNTYSQKYAHPPSVGGSKMSSPLSPPVEEAPMTLNGHTHTEPAVSHDFRSALSPNAAIPGRTIYSHSQQ